jgi:hypothetical protein
MDAIVKPDLAAIGCRHAVIQSMVFSVSNGLTVASQYLQSVLGMQVGLLEVWLSPLAKRVAENGPRPFTNIRDLKRRSVCAPHNGF